MQQPTGPARPYIFSVPPPPVAAGVTPMQPVQSSMGPTSPTLPVQVIRPSSVNERLTRYKKDSNQEISVPYMADLKQTYKGADARTCTTVPKLPVNSTHAAYLSHIEDGPYHFYVQLRSSVDNILPQLRNVFSRYPTTPITNQTIIPGTVIMAKGGDDVFKRAVIMIVQTETCKVYYIDYGNTEELAYSDIYALPSAAVELSQAMAMQFCLADIKSVNLTDQNKQYFARLVSDKLVNIRVTEKESKAPFQYCEIIAEGRNVRDVLAKLNSPMQYSNQYPPRGRECLILVVHVDSPSQFFVHYRSEIAVTTKIQEALSQYCPFQPRITDLDTINIGSPVGAIYPEDQKWYRALVMGMDSGNVTVFYVDYGNRHEVSANQLCLLSPELVNQWKSQAVECCLIGFEGVSPHLCLAKKMAETTLECCFTLKLQSIASGFRLNVDLIDEHGNSIANMMKNFLNENQKISRLPEKQVAMPERKPEDDRLSQHSSDSGGKRNKYQRPGPRGERREKPEVRPNPYLQHDDRGASDYKQRQGTRQEWKTGPRIPHMDGGGDESDSTDKPFVRMEGGERPSRATNGEREGKFNPRFDQKQFNNRENNNQGNDWGSRGQQDRKFEPREGRYGGGSSDSYNNRENKSSNPKHKLKGGYVENKFGDRENKFSDRNARFVDKKFANRDSKFTDKSKNSSGDSNVTAYQSCLGSTVNGESGEDCIAGSAPSPRRLSVVISEYPRQDIQTGKEYRVLFAMMEKTPQHVYVQLDECDPTLDKIRQMIHNDTEATSRTITQREAVLAMPVLARFKEDGLLYRATIKSKVASGQELLPDIVPGESSVSMVVHVAGQAPVEVLFVDYGNTDVVSISEVLKITPQQMAVPIQAIHIKVTDVPSSESPVLDACEAHFQSSILLLKPTRTIIVDLEQVVEGTLIRPDGLSVAECLKNDPQCGVGIPPLPKMPQQLQVQEEMQQTPQVEVKPPQPVEEIPVQVPSATPHQDTTAPVVETASSEDTLQSQAVFWVERLDLLVGQRLEAKILEILAENCYSIKIKACFDLDVPARAMDSLNCKVNAGDDVIVDVLSVSEEALVVNYYDGNGQSLSGGSSVPKICPMPIVQRSGTFSVCHKENETIFLQKEDTSEMMDLVDRMYQLYNASEVPRSSNFKVGDICVANSIDAEWHRARISAITGSSYSVYFIDYGNFGDISADKIRPLAPTIVMPELCVKVTLPLKYKDVDECFKEFDEECFEGLENKIKCTFIRQNTIDRSWTVDLFNSSGKSYAQRWIEENKAENVGDIAVDPKLRAAGWSLRKGDSIPIIVTHVESVSHFFAHLRDNMVDLDAMESKIQALPPDSVDFDYMFAAKYEDSVWYRAVSAGEQVFYLDHGNTDEALERRKLPDEFKRPREGFAIGLHLCVAPVGIVWTDEANSIFDDFINKEDLKMIVKSLNFKNVVDLQSGDQLLSSLLIDGGHAIPAELKFGAKQFINKEVESQGGDSAAPVENEELTPTAETVSKTNQEMEDLSFKPIEPSVDKDLYKNCTLAHSNGPYDFFVHTDDDQIKIEEMANSLFEAGSFPKLTTVKKGDFVIAQFIDDDAYYRAVVTNVEPEIVVHFVDYGNSSPATTFHQLPNDLKHITQLALRCSLQSPVGGWSVDAIDKFENVTDEAKAFDLKILTRGDPNIVDVVIDGQSITHLLDAGAKFETPSQHTPSPSAEVVAQPVKELVSKSADNETASVTVGNLSSSNVQKSLLKDSGYCYICRLEVGECYIQDEDCNSDVERIMELLQNIDKSDESQVLKDVSVGDWVVTLFEESYYRATVRQVDPLEVFFVDYGNCSPAEKFFKPPADLIKIKPLAVKVNLYLGDGLSLNEAGCAELQNLAEQGADYVLKGESTVELSIDGSKVADLLKDYLVSSKSPSPDQSANPLAADTIALGPDAAAATTAASASVPEAAATPATATPVPEAAATVPDAAASMPDAAVTPAKVIPVPEAATPMPQAVASPTIATPVPEAVATTLETAPTVPDAAAIPVSATPVPEATATPVPEATATPVPEAAATVPDAVATSPVAASTPAAATALEAGATAPSETTTSAPATTPEVVITPPTTTASSTVAGPQNFEVLVSHVVSPSEFYYQVDLEKVNEVVSRLATAENDFESVDSCKVDEIVCALFDEDGEWYRAKVITSEPLVNVFFIDYGNFSEVEKWKKLPEDLVKLAPLCVRASLEHPEKPWTEEEMDKFIEVAYNATFTCTVLKQDGRLDSQIVSIESSSTGDMLAHLRSCSEPSEDSIYLTPSDSTANASEAGALSPTTRSSPCDDRTNLADPELHLSKFVETHPKSDDELVLLQSQTMRIEPTNLDNSKSEVETILDASEPSTNEDVEITPISGTNAHFVISGATEPEIAISDVPKPVDPIDIAKSSNTKGSEKAKDEGNPPILSTEPTSTADPELVRSSKELSVLITTQSMCDHPIAKVARAVQPADLIFFDMATKTDDVKQTDAKLNAEVVDSVDIEMQESEVLTVQLAARLVNTDQTGKMSEIIDSPVSESFVAQIEKLTTDSINDPPIEIFTGVPPPDSNQITLPQASCDDSGGNIANSGQTVGIFFKPLSLKEAVLSVIEMKDPKQITGDPNTDALPTEDVIVDSEIPNLPNDPLDSNFTAEIVDEEKASLDPIGSFVSVPNFQQNMGPNPIRSTPDVVAQPSDEHQIPELAKSDPQIVVTPLSENDYNKPSQKTGTANSPSAKPKTNADALQQRSEIPSLKSKETPAPLTGPPKRAPPRPIKSLAEIKASAKPRISVGQTLATAKKSKPTKPALPGPSVKTIAAKEDDKIVPGCVLGNF